MLQKLICILLMVLSQATFAVSASGTVCDMPCCKVLEQKSLAPATCCSDTSQKVGQEITEAHKDCGCKISSLPQNLPSDSGLVLSAANVQLEGVSSETKAEFEVESQPIFNLQPGIKASDSGPPQDLSLTASQGRAPPSELA